MATSDASALSRITRREALRRIGVTSAAVLVAGCRPGGQEQAGDATGGGDATPEVFDVSELQALLDRRAKAQMDRDEAAYLADLDASNKALVRREQLMFANLQQFPVDDVQYVTGNYTGPPVRQQPTYRYVPVQKVVRLSADAAPEEVIGPAESFEYVVTRREDAWVVSDIVPLTRAELRRREGQDTSLDTVALGLNAIPANAPWNQTRLQVVSAGNVTLAADDSVPDLDRYARIAKAEARDVEQLWGDRSRFPGHVLFLTRRKKALRKWYEFGAQGVTGVREGFSHPALGVADTGDTPSGAAAGSRNVIFLPGAEKLGRDPRATIRHELVHSMTRRLWNGEDEFSAPPGWAVEGFAAFVEVRGKAGPERDLVAAAVNGFTGALPRTEDHAGPDAFTAYGLSYSVFRFLEQTSGLDTAIDFYAELVKQENLGLDGSDVADSPGFELVCLDVVGVSGAELLDQWAGFVQAGA